MGGTTANIRQEVKWIDDNRKEQMLLKDLKRLDLGNTCCTFSIIFLAQQIVCLEVTPTS